MAQRIIPLDEASSAAALFGAFDVNIRIIEQAFGVSTVTRDGGLVITGADGACDAAAKTAEHIMELARRQGTVSEREVDYIIGMVSDGREDELASFDSDTVCLTYRGKPIKAKTVGQKKYVDKIKNNTVTFGIGPAGTGKTFLAVGMAVGALRRKETERIILTRPAIEAGENLGFLPGDLQSKIEPYLRPLYDALYEMLGMETVGRYTERGVIEIAPLAYMRGRTLDNSFIILDEAQNTTPEQMKMFLTRLGAGSKAVITGDLTQTDIPRGKKSGLADAIPVLEGIEGISVHSFDDRDVVRHRLVQRIILAYEKRDRSREKNEQHIYHKRAGQVSG